MESDTPEVAGGWRLLCANMLLQAVRRAEESSKIYKHGRFGDEYSWQKTGNGACKERLNQRMVAREWLDGGVGVVTFEECCETLGLEPEKFRKKIAEWCNSRKRKPPKELEVDLV